MKLPKNSRKSNDGSNIKRKENMESIFVSSSTNGQVSNGDVKLGERKGAKRVVSLDQYGRTFEAERDPRGTEKRKNPIQSSDGEAKFATSTTSIVCTDKVKRSFVEETNYCQSNRRKSNARSRFNGLKQYALTGAEPCEVEQESSQVSTSYSVCAKLEPKQSAADFDSTIYRKQSKLRLSKVCSNPRPANDAVHKARPEKDELDSSSVCIALRASLNPLELTNKLNQVSSSRRIYYVQRDSTTNSIELSTSNSNQTMITLPEGRDRDVKTSMRGLAGSMATLKTTNFVECGRKVDTLAGNALYWNQTSASQGEPTPPRPKCELKLLPEEIYRKNVIIDTAVQSVSPVDAQETIDFPGADGVAAVRQICEGIDDVFRELQLVFTPNAEMLGSAESFEKLGCGELSTPGNKPNSEVSNGSNLIGSKKLAYHSEKLGLSDSVDLGLSAPEASCDRFPVWTMYDNEDIIKGLNDPKIRKTLKTNGDINTTVNKQPESIGKSSTALQQLKLLSKLSSMQKNQDLMGATVFQYEDHRGEPNIVGSADIVGAQEPEELEDVDICEGYQMHPIVMTAKISPQNSETIVKDSSTSQDNDIGQKDDTDPSLSASQSVFSTEPTINASSSGSMISQCQQSTTMIANVDSVSHHSIPIPVISSYRRQVSSSIQQHTSTTNKTASSEISQLLQSFGQKMRLASISVDDEPEICNSYKLLRKPKHKNKEPFHLIHKNLDRIKPTGPYGLLTKYSVPVDLSSSESNRDSKSAQLGSNSQKNLFPNAEGSKNNMVEDVRDDLVIVESIDDQLIHKGDSAQRFSEDVIIEQEMQFNFPFAFRLSPTTSWWAKVTGPNTSSGKITKEMLPVFHKLREQLETFLNCYEERYRQYENVYKWSKSDTTKAVRKLYVSPIQRSDFNFNQEPNRFTMSDEALSMKSLKAHRPSHARSAGYTTASCYIESKKWWMVSKVRRYVLRRKLAKYFYERDKMMKLGLRKKPLMHPASLILGCKQRVKRHTGVICQRNGVTKKRWMELLMKRNIPKEIWKAQKAKYELASSLRYRRRHHWNPFDPVNRPSLDGSTRLGWYGRSLIRCNNVTYLGQFSKGVDDQRKAEVRAITEQEVQNAWQRDLMEIAYVTYGSQQHITEELQFLIIVSFWLGIVIDQFLYFVRFVLNNIKNKPLKKIPYEDLINLPNKHSARRFIRQSDATNRTIWNKMMSITDKTIFMLKRHAIDLREREPSFEQQLDGNIADKHELPVTVPWYERMQLKKTNEQLLDGISLAYPDFYYLAQRKNKYYFVDLEEDDMKWFPIRYYDADTGEYNFISHDHPKWPDWKFLQMMSYNRSQDVNPISIYPWLKDEDPPSPRASVNLAENFIHDLPNKIDGFEDSVDVNYEVSNSKQCSQKNRNLIVMAAKECYDGEGNFRHLLVNPIKFNKKRVDLFVKTIGRVPNKLGLDLFQLGLGDFKLNFIRDEDDKKRCGLDSKSIKQIICKYAGRESPQRGVDRRINIALDYWYRKSALINRLLESSRFKVKAIDRVVDWMEANVVDSALLMFDKPKSLKLENEDVWKKKIHEHFTAASESECGHETDSTSQDRQCLDVASSDSDNDKTPQEKIPMDFLKMLHTYFSLTSIETLRKENFVPFPVPRHTTYCIEHMKPPSVVYSAVPYNKMSLRTRIATRHRQRLSRRRSLIKKYKTRRNEAGELDVGHARCLGFDPRRRVGYRGPCPICHKMVISHHPSLSLYIDFRRRHIDGHKLCPGRVQPPNGASACCYDHNVECPEFKGIPSQQCLCKVECHCGAQHPASRPRGVCYLHCKIPTILSIFQGQSVSKKRQESLIRYFARVLNFENSVVKNEINTRLKEETGATDSLKYKRNFLNDLHEFMCGPSVCQTIGDQIRSLLNYQELAMKYNKRAILSSRYCKRRTGWPLKLATQMSEEEILTTMRQAHNSYPYTLTPRSTSLKQRQLSTKAMNNLYICWMDTSNRGISLLSHMEKYIKSDKLYASEDGVPSLLQALKKLEITLPMQPAGHARSSAPLLSAKPQPPTNFDLWFSKFVSNWDKIGTSTSTDMSSPTAPGSNSVAELSWLSSQLDLKGMKLNEYGSITPLMDVDSEDSEEVTPEELSSSHNESSTSSWDSSVAKVLECEIGINSSSSCNLLNQE